MFRIVCLFTATGILLASPSPLRAEGPSPTTITYQGQLKLDGVGLDEPCDAIFTLYDAPTGGNVIAQIGSFAAPVAMQVEKGVFTTMLDFGDGAFDGGPRWLEVSVRRSADAGVYTVLSPRQCLTPTPYALHAKTGGDPTSLDEAYNKGGPGEGRSIQTNAGPLALDGPGGLFVQGNVGIGVNDPTHKLELDGWLRLHQGGIIFADGTTQTTAAAPGQVGDGPRGGDAYWNDNGSTLYVDPLNTFVGIGTSNPQFPLHIVGDVRCDGSVRASAFASNSPFVAEAPAGVSRLFIDDVSGFMAIGHTNPQRDPQSLLHLADDLEDPIITLETNPDGTNAIGFAGIDFTDRTGMVSTLQADLLTVSNLAGVPEGLFINRQSMADVHITPFGGFVGIGLGNELPENPLHVAGTGGMTANLSDGVHMGLDVASQAHIELVRNLGTPYIDFTRNPANNFDARIILNADNTLSLDAIRVGIGTNAPFRKLQVVDSSFFVTRFTGTNTDSAIVEFRSASSNATWEYAVSGSVGAFSGAMPPGSMYLFRQGLLDAVPFIIEPEGFVGINFPFANPITPPQAALEVRGTPGVDGIMFPDGTLQTSAATNDHGSLMGLLDDDHPQYAHLPGRAGGQILNGGINIDETLELHGSTMGGDVLLNPAGNGDVGIGTFLPEAPLHLVTNQFVASRVDSDSVFGTWHVLGNQSAGGSFWQLISTGTNNGGGPGNLIIGNGPAANLITAATMALNSATNHVGIGTASPDVRLHVIGGTDVNAVSGGFLQLGASNALNLALDDNEIQARSNGVAADLAINREGGNVRIGAISSGNLGIGPIVPVWSIDVVDTQAVTRLITSSHTNGSVLELRNDTTNPDYVGAINFNTNLNEFRGQIGYLGTNDMTFRVNGIERVRFDSMGNVGIGTTMPEQQLHVVNNARVDGTVYTEMVSSNAGLSLQLKTGDAPHIHIEETTGYVGVGPNPPMPPEEALHVDGCVKADCYKVNGEKPIDVSPLTAVASSTALTMIPTPNGTMRVRPNQTGTQNVLIPVHVASSILGTPQELVRVRVCYRVTSSLSFINNTRARTTQDNGTFVNLLDNDVDRKSIAWNCYEVVLPMSVAIDGPLYLQLELSIGGTGSAHDIEVGRVTVTVVDA